jgi:hypothetical protein
MLSFAACSHGTDGSFEGQGAVVNATDAWKVNDVSFLFPYPQKGEGSLLIGMKRSTPSGERALLPEEVFNLLGRQEMQVGYMIETFGRDKLYPALRVISARIDPCFDSHDASLESHCVRQVRLSVQPVVPESWDPASGTYPVDDPQSGYFINDASLHLFFPLDDAAFVKLLLGLRELKVQNTENAPLSVHPVMKREGLGGPFAARLKELLLEACEGSHLSRMTMMSTGRTNNWFWHILEPDAQGRWVTKNIPGTTPQRIGDGFTQFVRQGDDHDGSPLDSPLFPDAFLKSTNIPQLSEAQFLAGMDQLEKIQNPELLTTSEVNCSSCHVAGNTLGHAVARRGLSATPRTPSTFTPPPGQNVTLADETSFSGSNVHALGWVGTKAGISQRAVNESARVASFLGSEAFAHSLPDHLRATWLRR